MRLQPHPRLPGPLDVEEARRETAGCKGVVHLNNAGSSLMPDVVLQTVIEHLELEARIGGYEAAARENGRNGLELNGSGNRIALVGHGTEQLGLEPEGFK